MQKNVKLPKEGVVDPENARTGEELPRGNERRCEQPDE